ncbi:hypothetical protein LNP74_21935 [Klebsiella pneumoniae subsp. pneumoniae]|nr:hypothetical protein [Klebsiella pneumoniae subsp. pneumoniae]
MLADVKKQLAVAGVWRAGAEPAGLAVAKSWPMSSLCSTKRASPKTSSVLKPIRRWRSPEAALRSRVEECWHLTEQNEMYEAFIALFRPSTAAAAADCDPSELTPDRCFQIQLLLIHFYRRVVLKDPRCYRKSSCRRIGQGQTARQLCINIYQRVSPGALAFVSEKGGSSVGELPAPGPLYYQRFGGLPGA